MIPAAAKGALREELTTLQKRVTEASKAAAAANKATAIAAAVTAADAAAAAGTPFVALRLEVGSDAKAVTEAWNALSAKHPSLAGLFLSADDAKVVAYAAVPDAAQAKLKANEWLGAALKVGGGTGVGGGGRGVALLAHCHVMSSAQCP